MTLLYPVLLSPTTINKLDSYLALKAMYMYCVQLFVVVYKDKIL